MQQGEVEGNLRPATDDEWINSRRRRVILKTGKKLRPFVNRVLARYSRVGDRPVFDSSVFAWTRELEANWELIRREAEQVLDLRDRIPPLRLISPDHARIAGSDHWKSFFLYGYGLSCDNNRARCPETTRVIEKIPNLQSAFFSIMTPGTHLKRHRGPTKGLMTCHLGLILPRQPEKCLIEIHRKKYYWSEGKTLVFDDTFKHEVWNQTDEDRVVLLIHFLRPLRFPGNLVRWLFLTAIKLSPFVRDARRKQREWDAQHGL
jgi:beta-hydroxylase